MENWKVLLPNLGKTLVNSINKSRVRSRFVRLVRRSVTAIETALMSTLAAGPVMTLERRGTFVACVADSLARFAVYALNACWSFQDGVSDGGDSVGYCKLN